MPNRRPPDRGVEPEDVDPGDPIAELERLRLDPDAEFVHRIRRSIDRRDLATHVVQVTMFVPVHMIFEFLRTLAVTFGSWTDGKGGQKPWNKNSGSGPPARTS